MSQRPQNVLGDKGAPQPWISPTLNDVGHPIFFLQLFDPHGYRCSARILGPSCLVGSSPDSQIRIQDLDLADSHAIVSSTAGILTITACHEARVLVNGKEVKGTARLKQGDKVALGHSLIATVNASHLPTARAIEVPATKGHDRTFNLQGRLSRWLRTALGYKSATLSLLAVSVVLASALALSVLLTERNQSDGSAENKTEKGAPQKVTAAAEISRSPGVKLAAAPGPAAPPDKIRSAVQRVMRRIGRQDLDARMNESVLADVGARIDAYIADGRTLRVMTQQVGDLSAVMRDARREDIEPSLLILDALLEVIEAGGQSNDNIATASRSVLPELKRLAIIFNSKDANSCLIIVAVQGEIKEGRTVEDVLRALRKDVKDPKRDRNFRFLFEQGHISKTSYNRVIRFLALGALALEPQSLGLDNEPLHF